MTRQNVTINHTDAYDTTTSVDDRLSQLRDVNESLIMAALRAQTAADQTERLLLEVSRVSGLDDLTHLANRALMFDRFAQAAAMASRHNTRLGVVFLDIDHFSQINETFGHAVGDEVLRRVASSLLRNTRGADTVSRHGGDEFLILLTDLDDLDALPPITAKITKALRTPLVIDGFTIHLSASVGISAFPDDGRELLTLIGLADVAMYHAKRRGFGGVVFHSDISRDEESPARLTPEPDWHALSEIDLPDDSDLSHLPPLQAANEQLLLTALTAQSRIEEVEGEQRRQTDFMGVLAHELRNPLGPMRNVAAILPMIFPGNPALTRLQLVIERQVTHMTRLLDDLLDVSRISTGKLRLMTALVNLVDVVTSSALACQPTIEARHHTLTLNLGVPTAMIVGDPIRLTQIITNLIDNAAKYTPDNGAIGLRLESDDTYVKITVSDNGIGIAEEAQARIFGLFEQEARAAGFSKAGLGIGLSIVRDLVNAHGGSIVARSAGVGHGSAFILTLPLDKA
ncbi:MAG: diguanylate cyclase [Gemmatimonadaceae bacterium]|nr:diguanylate cyclase [Gemmatimonadaceae bacterium]